MKKIAELTVLFALLVLFGGQKFADAKVIGESIDYGYKDVVMRGFLAYDDQIKGKRPGIIVVHEWWGNNDYSRKRAEMLAELGYTAFALDMYGDGKQAINPDEAKKLSSEVMKDFDTAKGRFIAAMDILKKHPSVDPLRIGAIGYCFGGGVVLNMARQGIDFKGGVSFHGGLNAVKPAEKGSVKAVLLVLHGEDDKFISPEEIEGFKKEMTSAGVSYKFISYPGAVHAFSNPLADEYGKKFNIPIAYNAEADKKSWEEMKNFLASVVKK